MIKKLLTLILCLFISAVCVLPAAAVNSITRIDAPYGIQYKVNSDGTSERVTICCLLTDALAQITGDEEYRLSNAISYAFAFIQLDYRVDGGDWQYEPSWDTVPDSSTYGTTINSGETAKTLDLLYLTNQTAVDACGELAVKTDSGKKLFDLENHSLEFRMRVSLGYTDTQNRVINSDWTDVIEVKREQDFEPLPTVFEAPQISDLKVEYVETSQMPFLTFKVKTPESIKKAQSLYSTQISTGFSLQCYVDTGDGFELVTMSSSGSFYSNETKNVYLSAGDFADENRVKVKLQYMIYDKEENTLYSDASEVLSVVTPRWEDGKGILHAKCTTCGICRPIFGVCMFIVLGIAALIIVIAAVIIKMQLDKARNRREELEAQRQKEIAAQKAAYDAAKKEKKEKNRKK